MKTKKSKRVMAVVMAVLLTVGIMPMDWAVTKAAASTVHSFDATAQASVGDDKAVIAEGTTFNDGYFKIVGKVTQRTNSDGSNAGQDIGQLRTTWIAEFNLIVFSE